MPRIARVVVPGRAHHVTQRGNRRADVFFDEADRRRYLTLLSEYKQRYGLEIVAYCLMTNHVHLVAIPATAEAMGRALHDTHQAYAVHVNRKQAETGHLWQGRFYSAVLDGPHFWSAIRYVERNPVRAGLVARAEEYPWSSARGHCGLAADALLLALAPPEWLANMSAEEVHGWWAEWLRNEDEREKATIRHNTLTGRPCGSASFVQTLEGILGRVLHPQKPGPKAKAKPVKPADSPAAKREPDG